jgi:hypothetical protein
MPAIITDDHRKNNANAFVTDVNTLALDSPLTQASGYYIGIGKSDPWSDETTPPTPTGSELERQDAIQNLISMKLLSSTNIERLLPKTNQTWGSGNVWKRYDRTDRTCFNIAYDGSTVTSRGCYAIGTDGYLYLCLDNNGGANSTVAPQSSYDSPSATVDGEVTQGSDGYMWVRIGQVPTGSDFANSSTFFEIPVNITPAANSTQGLLYGFKIVSAGSGYTDGTHPAKLRYTQIDGTTATSNLHIVVSDEKVTSVFSGDSPADALTLTDFVALGVGSTNGILKASIDFTTAPTTSSPYVEAEIQPLIAPADGFGANNLDVFPAYYLGVSSDFDGNDSPAGETPVDLTFRQVSIIKSPKFDSANDSPESYGTIDSLSYILMDGSEDLSSLTPASGWYVEKTTTGEKAWIDYIDDSGTPDKIYFHQNSSSTVTQDLLPLSGTLKIFNASGVQQPNNSTTFDYTSIVDSEHYDNALDHSPLNSPITLSQLDLSGEVLMLDNRTSITRSSSQNDKVRIVLQF